MQDLYKQVTRTAELYGEENRVATYLQRLKDGISANGTINRFEDEYSIDGTELLTRKYYHENGIIAAVTDCARLGLENLNALLTQSTPNA
jgi:hypothetical protein